MQNENKQKNTPEIQRFLDRTCFCRLQGDYLEQGVNKCGYKNYISLVKEVHNGVYNTDNEIIAKFNELIGEYSLANYKKEYCSMLVKAIHNKYGRLAHAETLIASKTKELKAAKNLDELTDIYQNIYLTVMLD